MKDETVLITGASRGIGAAIAYQFAAAGSRVLINYHHGHDPAEQLVRSIRQQGGQAELFAADVSQPEKVGALFAYAEDRWQQPVTILVNNAGIGLRRLITDTTEQDLDQLLALNFKAPFFCSRRALSGMLRIRKGCIINIGSVFGTSGAAFEAAYAATKGALHAFTLSLAAEAGPNGIRVNLISPGAVATAMLNELDSEDLDELTRLIPLHRLGLPEDIAAACVFLASPQAAYIHGQNLVIDGGWTLS
jgi:3-oxoacyl-[acyl-carrier protein] reductase